MLPDCDNSAASILGSWPAQKISTTLQILNDLRRRSCWTAGMGYRWPSRPMRRSPGRRRNAETGLDPDRACYRRGGDDIPLRAMMKKTILAAALLLSAGMAQVYPSRPVTLIVPYPAGG